MSCYYLCDYCKCLLLSRHPTKHYCNWSSGGELTGIRVLDCVELEEKVAIYDGQEPKRVCPCYEPREAK